MRLDIKHTVQPGHQHMVIDGLLQATMCPPKIAGQLGSYIAHVPPYTYAHGLYPECVPVIPI